MKDYLVVKMSDGSIQTMRKAEKFPSEVPGYKVLGEVCDKECNSSCPNYGRNLCSLITDWNEDSYMMKPVE